MQINESRLIKQRRTKSEMSELRETIFEAVQQDKPMTVRQVFYRLTTMGVISKTENQYKNTVERLLVDMRKKRELPYAWIADSTRWVRQPDTHNSIQDALEWGAKNYRRSLWSQGPAYVEIWLEKEALAGVLYDVTDEWDVPLYVTRGYSSLSFLHTSGQSIQGRKYPTYLYYFGDHDPSGVDIPRVVERGIREFSGDSEVHFERVAVTEGQIEEWGLPTRPTKKTDSRSKNFQGESVEVDAIPPDHLRELCRGVIEQHLPIDERDRVLEMEAAERDSFKEVARYWQEMIS
jgi:hypothetical protein